METPKASSGMRVVSFVLRAPGTTLPVGNLPNCNTAGPARVAANPDVTPLALFRIGGKPAAGMSTAVHRLWVFTKLPGVCCGCGQSGLDVAAHGTANPNVHPGAASWCRR